MRKKAVLVSDPRGNDLVPYKFSRIDDYDHA